MSYEEEKQDRKIEQLEAEIERLRGFETAARDLNNDLIRIAGERDELAAQIQEMRAELVRVNQLREIEIDQAGAAERIYLEAARLKDARIEELLAELASANVELMAAGEIVVAKDARILGLEDVLVEKLAKQFDVDEPCPARTHHEYCDILKGLCDGFPHMWKQCPRKPEKLDAARQQLQAEGKIGPDADAKPHCWQITEERKAAIKELSELLTAIGCPSCHYYIQKNYGENITVLRAMLTEADHDKP